MADPSPGSRSPECFEAKPCGHAGRVFSIQAPADYHGHMTGAKVNKTARPYLALCGYRPPDPLVVKQPLFPPPSLLSD